jgi:hypothetical protein
VNDAKFSTMALDANRLTIMQSKGGKRRPIEVRAKLILGHDLTALLETNREVTIVAVATRPCITNNRSTSVCY